YGMLIFAMICYAMPNLTGRNRMNTPMSIFAFWCTTIGMVAMTVAFGIAGIGQVYMERKLGLDFMQVQQELEIHFFGLVMAATLFTCGFLAYVYEFIKSGQPIKDISLSDKAFN